MFEMCENMFLYLPFVFTPKFVFDYANIITSNENTYNLHRIVVIFELKLIKTKKSASEKMHFLIFLQNYASGAAASSAAGASAASASAFAAASASAFAAASAAFFF